MSKFITPKELQEISRVCTNIEEDKFIEALDLKTIENTLKSAAECCKRSCKITIDVEEHLHLPITRLLTLAANHFTQLGFNFYERDLSYNALEKEIYLTFTW